MHIEWNRVTWYSKLLAVLVFLATFLIAFYLGRAYQAGRDADALVDRLGSFENGAERFCGGIAAIQCPEGFSCKLDGGYPDAGGRCVKD